MARKKDPPPPTEPPAKTKSGAALDVASAAPWILFWGWVALDSALAYRQSQAALDQAAEAEAAQEHQEAPPVDVPHIRRWLMSSPKTLDGLRAVQKRTRAAMISAPIIALVGPMLLRKLTRRQKP